MAARLRCVRCQRPLSHCLCSLIPSLSSRVQVQILQHPDEARHALNTARLAVLGLETANLCLGEQFPHLPIDSGTYLLFPGPEARSLKELTLAEQTAVERLIVLDGTWRKARKLLYLNPALQALPQLKLPEGCRSRYRVRKAPMPDALSTVEAIVIALSLIEHSERFEALLVPFEALIEGQIAAMGAEVYQRNHGC